MPFVEEFWNNTTSPYKNWHKKIKWFSIFIKPNKCQKIRKEKEIGKRELTCGLALCGLAWPSRPAQLTGQRQSSPSSRQRDRARGRRTPHACTPRQLPACPLPSSTWPRQKRPAPPWPHSLLSCSPLPSSSPARMSRSSAPPLPQRARSPCSVRCLRAMGMLHRAPDAVV